MIRLEFHQTDHTSTPRPCDIILYQTRASDLLLDLGPPLRTYDSQDDRFTKLWNVPSSHRQPTTDTSDHQDPPRPHDRAQRGGAAAGAASSGPKQWWNYFQLGLDIQIDETQGVVVKIMVHSNIHHTPLFQRHARCPWTIVTRDRTTLTLMDSLVDITHHLAANATVEEAADGSDAAVAGPLPKRSSNAAAAARQPTVSVHNPPDLSTLSFDRTKEPGFEDLVHFGPSKILALDGIMLEEAEQGGITAVLIF